jgi:transcriptional regulator with XRE-family HTH domain
MPNIFPILLRTHRKRWALRQRDLAFLLGVSASAISQYENAIRQPSLSIALALEVVFGVPISRLLPNIYCDAEAVVMARAEILQGRLADFVDAKSAKKRDLLKDMLERVEPLDPGL